MKITFPGIGKVGPALADNLTRAQGRGPDFVWAMLSR
jgi:predicted dinucleotide-binding enzyme